MKRDVKEVLGNLQKKYGKSAIIMGNELPPLAFFPTDIAMLDLHTGGGVPMGQITVLGGTPQSGKTSLALQICAKAQKEGFQIVWGDLEKSFDRQRAEVFGLDVDSVIFLRTSKDNELSAEQLRVEVMDVIREFNKLEDNRLFIVIDSLAANVSEKLLDEDADKTVVLVGGDAKVNNQSIRNWNVALDKNQALIIINQFRDKIGAYGNPADLTGGWAQKYFARLIIFFRGGDVFKEKETAIGEQMKWTIKKANAAPREIGGVAFYYATGYDKEESLIQACLELGILEKSGSWFTLPDDTRVQGLQAFVTKLRDDKPLLDTLKRLFYAKLPRDLYEYKETGTERG